MMLKTGIDVLEAQNFEPLVGLRVGLLTNPSAVNHQMISTYQLMLNADNVTLVAVYGAEHGAFGRVEAGEEVGAMVDSQTGIPIHSLYGKTYRPTADMLANIEVMVCDIQDIGVRYYTYLWTITYVAEVCGELDIPVIILDRPNPLGDTIAGCGLLSEFASLVGRFDVPIQHGMSIGEVLQMHNALWNPTPADLKIIPCEQYERTMTWADFERPFVPTSPNIPHMSTVKHYSGACLVEGTTLSEGRGTTLPFEIVGAPYLDGRALAERLNDLELADVRFRPHQFTPLMSKYANIACDGIQTHIVGTNFNALKTWLHVIHTIKEMHPDDFGWRPPFVEGDHPPFDKLIGSDRPRKMLDSGATVEDIMQEWHASIAEFHERRQPYLIY